MARLLVGKINFSDTGCSEEIICQWTIDDFLSNVWRQSITLESPILDFSDNEYRLNLTITNADGPLELCCRKVSSSPFENLNVKLGMRTGSAGEGETRSGKMDRGIFAVNFWKTFSEFLQKRSDILINGHLTVFCELRLDVEENASVLQGKLSCKKNATVENGASEDDSDKEEMSSEEEHSDGETSESDCDDDEWIAKRIIIKKMQKDFKKFLTSREDSDVTIKVQGKEFPAHRGILRCRSPVFNSMFHHDMVEKQNGVVVIDDCDPDAFPVFLEYLYSGSTKDICDENVISLYTASDKYGVKELKDECVSFMEVHLSVATVCDTITLALRHTEKELVDAATTFFCDNVSEILETAKWLTFLSKNSTVGNALFIKALSRYH